MGVTDYADRIVVRFRVLVVFLALGGGRPGEAVAAPGAEPVAKTSPAASKTNPSKTKASTVKSAAPSSKASAAKTRGSAASARGSAASYARLHATQPEEIYLEEEETTPERVVPAAPMPRAPAPPTSGAAAPPTASGRKVRASLETSGYLDSDHVKVLSPSVAGGITDEVAGWSVNGHYLVDVVSAASVDIVSTASPHWTEVRHAGSVTGSMTFEPFTAGALAVISREPDYLSITGGATLGFDLLQKNLSPYFAFSHEADSVGRHGLPHEYWKSKRVENLQVGLTFVLGRATIASAQWDGSFERGYLAKPYRYVPLFAPGQASAVGAGASTDEVNRLRLNFRPSEQLPAARDRYALSGHLAHRYDSSTLRVDERLYADSWGLLASTSELRYLIDVGRKLELWPHVRYHVQGAVSFWQRAYEAVQGPGGSLGVPVFRAGDRELSPLQTIVLGAGSRANLTEAPGSQWDLVLEVDVGRTHFNDALYITERYMTYTTLAVEAEF